tara:strand:+ start:226 stop:522 length:297 start_codon:yes stop_codon:yes gene_type:complete
LLEEKSSFFLQQAIIGDECDWFEFKTPAEWDRCYRREELGEYSEDDTVSEVDNVDKAAYEKALETMWSENLNAHETELPIYVSYCPQSWDKYMDECSW